MNRIVVLNRLTANECTKVFKRFCSTNKSVQPVKNESNSDYEEKKEWNVLKVFGSKKSSFLELHRYNPFNVSTERLKLWKLRLDRDTDLMDQKFIKDRHSILGNDLATAHFILFRNGRVKFIGQSDWIKKNKEDEQVKGLPRRFVEGWLLEGVDASGLLLRYEGFENLKGLYELRTLILRDCPNIDDWCVDRLSGEFQETLEHLDLSGCPKITERALTCLYRCKRLKSLVLENVVQSKSFEFHCLLLEEALPQLTITGVKYLEIPESQVNNT